MIDKVNYVNKVISNGKKIEVILSDGSLLKGINSYKVIGGVGEATQVSLVLLVMGKDA